MTRKRTLSAALATTASVALLAGLSPAQAQMGGTPGGPCSTTVVGPAIANCTLPSSKAPGAGSFPGSFLVPGTTTSFAVHGIIYFEVDRDLGPHQADTTANGLQGVVLQGPGASAAGAGPSAANGGLSFNDKGTRPNIETRTPTAYGELKTYIEMDFNQTASYQLTGNNDLLRLRQAYGTLGPWLLGQTNTAYEDPQAWPDIADAGVEAGMIGSANVRKPQARYTYLAGNGVSIVGSVELPTYNSSGAPAFGFLTTGSTVKTLTPDDSATTTGAYTPYTNSVSSSAWLGGYYNWPKFVAATQWDQPWGHAKLAVEGGFDEARTTANSSTLSGAVVTTGGAAAAAFPLTPFNQQQEEFAVSLSGHVNTWGKDRLGGAVRYNYGASDYSTDMYEGGYIYNTGTGAMGVVKAVSVFANYEHFFSSQWRGNLTFGYVRLFNPTNLAGGSVTTLAGLDNEHFTSHVNVIFAPVPQLDLITEWMHDYRSVESGAGGTTDRLLEQAKFYF